jgi:hypothetical protein
MEQNTGFITTTEGFGRQNDRDILARALRERDSFLMAHPELMGLQEEIDRLMERAGTSENRMAVLQIMMGARLQKLQQEMLKLLQILKQVESKAPVEQPY